MKKFSSPILLGALLVSGLLNSCAEKEAVVQDKQGISAEALNQIKLSGFSTSNVQRDEDGTYIVEGDIRLSAQELSQRAAQNFLRVGQDEQYRTTNLVGGLPRVITVSISSQLPASYVAGLDEAIARFNAENLQITFSRVSSGATISLVRGNGSYLASAGFPTAAGEPHNEVKINSRAIGNNPSAAYLGTILAHEIGHCIGFRHTDYMDRSYSCGGSTANEGASTVGAILIPGTPSAADPNSWMLACIGSGQSRPFNANDKTALNYLY
ncbi:zinc-dependent metalloprotease [Hymenobacter weizhouensis]|uniref:zinc-dependent metalloprotease n=1 Tax=Hymenobacter sp. YIM 151500-1 TaxID=2987689 RepID=UPI002226E69C|nr:zinc-dependent metalloprotease [Hymenobacter sp. YIM 151500-1]UYZ63233.1 zinc-dependent metalloprotease [Hymenobacter sp. YIM 151500-1]